MESAVSENRDALTVETVHYFIMWTAAVEGKSETVNCEENMSNSQSCIYYFGSFASSYEAQLCSGGYIEDLEQEGTKGVAINIKRGQPRKLTIFEDGIGREFPGES